MSDAQPATPLNQRIQRWAMFCLRWGIAVVGIWWVLSNVSLRDRVLILGPGNIPVETRVIGAAPERIDRRTVLTVIDPLNGEEVEKRRIELVNKPDRKTVSLREGNQRVQLLALDLSDDRDARVRRLLILDPETREGRWVRPSAVVDFQLHVPHPLVDRGLLPIIRNADPRYLWAAVLVYPVVYLITAWRWWVLLRALSIDIKLRRAFVLNMVGAFYNSFMPGSTGGDVLKAWYIAKQTRLRTRAVMSVIVDRVIGLVALVIMGGVMATYQYLRLPQDDPAKTWCARVSFGAILILTGTFFALFVFYHPMLRRFSGLDFVLRKLPMQTQVGKAVEAMHIYRSQPLLIFWALLVTFPVHATVVVSATFAGMAFGLPLHPLYYWVVVPVVVLSGAIPISPQGAGVMEFFAIMLTRRQGATVSQAFALTMSIRLVAMFWNLLGGIFVFRGGYHAPSEKEQQELATEPITEPAPSEAGAPA